MIQNNLRTPQLAGFARQLGCKNDLFPVDQELVVIDVVPVFGPYIKFVTGKVQVILKIHVHVANI